MIYNGQQVSWESWYTAEKPYRSEGWEVIFLPGTEWDIAAEAHVDGRWGAFDLKGNGVRTVGRGEAGNLEAAKAAAEKALVDAGLLTIPLTTVYYEGKSVEWRDVGKNQVLLPSIETWCLAIVDVHEWFASRLGGNGFYQIGHGPVIGGNIIAAKAAATKCLLDNGIVTTSVSVTDSDSGVGTFVFNYRADKGGATAAVVVSRLPKETAVVYGVAFCAPSDEYDKETGARLAAYRLVTEPLSLFLSVGVGVKEIKAAIRQALVIPDGNRLVR